MFHEEILRCNAFDAAEMAEIPKVKVDTLVQKVFCLLGFHFCGFTHCLCCGKRDVELCEILGMRWAALTAKARDVAIDAMIRKATAAGLDPHTFIWKQLQIQWNSPQKN